MSGRNGAGAMARAGLSNERRPSRRTSISAVAVAIGLVLLVLVAAGVGGPARAAVGLVVGLFVPGWAVVGFVRLRSAEAETCLTLAVSLALVMADAQIMLWSGAWHPLGGLVVLVIGSTLACAVQLRVARGLVSRPS